MRWLILPLCFCLVSCSAKEPAMELPAQIVSEARHEAQHTVKTGSSMEVSHRVTWSASGEGGQIEIDLVNWHQWSSLTIQYQVSEGVEFDYGQLSIPLARTGMAYPLGFRFDGKSFPVDVELTLVASHRNNPDDQLNYRIRVDSHDRLEESDQSERLPAQQRVRVAPSSP